MLGQDKKQQLKCESVLMDCMTVSVFVKPVLNIHSAVFPQLHCAHSLFTFAPLWIQQPMCQACAIGSAATIMAAHSGDEQDLTNAAGGLVLLSITRSC